MDLITKEIQTKLKGKFSYLKLFEVKYDGDENTCTVVFMFPETISRMNEEDENEIRKTVTDLFDLKETKLFVAFKKSFLDEYLIADKVLKYLKSTYASFATGIVSNDIKSEKKNGVVHVTVLLSQQQFSFFREKNMSNELNLFLQSQFCGEFFIEPKIAKSLEFSHEIVLERQRVLQSNAAKETGGSSVIRYEVIDPVVLVGGEITPKPEFVQNITQTKERAILAGVIENLQEKTFVAKHGKKDKDGNMPQKKYYSFTIKDPSAKIRAVYFCPKSNEKKLSKLTEGDTILVIADVEVQDEKVSSCVVRDISYCTMKQAEISESIAFDLHAHSYTAAFPKPYSSKIQVDIFSKKQGPNAYLTENTFVVFDVETTGLDPEKCEIIEIGAAKVVGGVIVETFQTLVRPKSQISREITEITGITNDMVVSSPMIDNVIKDFALFAKGAILVAHNLSFDIRFVSMAGRRFGIVFDHEKLDTLTFVKSKMFLPNYKLGTIVKELKIDLTNAHRALFDAVATAEVLIKLNQESI